MAEFEDREGLAAEYVLGTLNHQERVQVEQAMAGDPEFAGLVEDWERRLSPLALALEPIAAPSHLKAKVLAAISAGSGQTGEVIELRQRVKRWRFVSAAGFALAAGLAGLIVFRAPIPEQGRYVAVLQAEGPGPAFLASVDLATGTISVRPVSAAAPTGKSYELWAVGAGREKPQSLGVIAADFRIPASKLGKIDKTALGDTTFAVSLEPQGGSPTGQPTGPVLFTGKLMATE